MHNIKGSGRFESEAWLLKQLTMAFFPSSLLFIFIFLILIFVSSLSSAKTQRFARSISPSSLGLDKPQKLSHLHFFFHDVVGGTNRTAVRVAAAPTTDHSPTGFGAVVMMDDPLTEQAEAASRAVGRAQGIYASASRTELGFLMALNFAFTEGKFNGSTLAVLGRNAVESAVREMPVVGGTGVFRFATGYAQARTHSLGALEAVVEYNVSGSMSRG
ncbi:dirigent protein 2 isoform X2 [Cajanus cajan]|uniref:dirigent protein 2 isoform X2 n=1 Tax=Cajanus cajan TaxID=3821 RepID=UPI00098D84DE|nr:dirigent protein 2 isoform X2 [Cajanus cajan]